MTADYLLLNTDFPWYSEVMIERPTIMFQADWKRKFGCSPEPRRDVEDVREALGKASPIFWEALLEAYVEAGYQLVDRPGREVLLVSTGITNHSAYDCELAVIGEGCTCSSQSVDPLLVLEVRDSMSGTLMAKAIDRRMASGAFEITPYFRAGVTSPVSLKPLFRNWAKISVDRMTRLEAMWPMIVHPRCDKENYGRWSAGEVCEIGY